MNKENVYKKEWVDRAAKTEKKREMLPFVFKWCHLIYMDVTLKTR